MSTGCPARTAREVLGLYQRAVLDQSAGDLASLYAADGVHEIPFMFPGMPERYTGRDEIRAAYGRAWSASPAKPAQFCDVEIHAAADADTIVVEQTLTGLNTATGASFRFPGVLVLRVRNGELIRTRDYMDGLRIANAMGRTQPPGDTT